MKAILLPTDFSKNSINAINYAMKFFEHTPCRFYLLNVQKASSFITDDMMVVSASASIYNTLIDTAKKSISNIIKQIQKKHKNDKHEFQAVVDYDNFVDSINQICEVYKIDLIVMGTKGASGLEKVFFGSNAVHVIQSCMVDILAIPDDCKYANMDKIVFTSSMKSVYKSEDFETLLDIAHTNKSNLDVVHVFEKSDIESQPIKNEWFFNTNFKNVNYNSIHSDEHDIYESIHKYAKENNVQLIAMLSKKHSFLERLLANHTAETFAFKTDIPLLVMQSSD